MHDSDQININSFSKALSTTERMESMENANEVTSEMPSTNSGQGNKLPIIGFILMLAGPIILLLAGFFTETFGYVPEIAANIIAWTAIILPGIGAIISIVSLFKWKKIGKRGRALAIVTVIMCNPFFYFIYLVMCGISSKTLAGLSWM